jgi:hypothetical protein
VAPSGFIPSIVWLRHYPKRQKRHGHREPDYPFKFIKERF